jgi:uncharacterized membrane protein
LLASVITMASAGALMVALGVPMMRRRVPPNGIYGLRVAATMADRWVWYEANARTGREFVYLGAAVFAASVGLPFVPGMTHDGFGGITTSLLVGGVILVAGVGWARANRLLREKQARDREGG